MKISKRIAFLFVSLLVSMNILAQNIPKYISKQDTTIISNQSVSPKKVQSTGGEFGDDDQQNPSTGDSDVEFGDSDQQNPTTDGNEDGFSDLDQQNPSTDDYSDDIIIGDVNLDGNIDISDVVKLVNIILGTDKVTSKYACDLNSDDNVDISDVVQLVNVILGQ